MSKLLTVTLDPEKWDRGRHASTQKLDDPDVALLGWGGLCCMGFAALALGATQEEIRDVGTWRDCGNETLAQREYPQSFSALYEANDALHLTDTKRVAKLNAIAAKLGLEFRFKLGKGGKRCTHSK